MTCSTGWRRATGGSACVAPMLGDSWDWERLGVAVFVSEVMDPFLDAARRARRVSGDRRRWIAYLRYTTTETCCEKKRGDSSFKTQMAQEIEIKLRVGDIAALKATLKKMGARLLFRGTGRVHEWNTLFDTAQQDLRKRQQLLRTRIETPDGHVSRGKKNGTQPALLTFKGPVVGERLHGGGSKIGGGHKVREEIEFRLGDAAAVAKILERLGMRPSFRYEKYRTTFRLPAN